jgi:Phthiocerol/phthiodiolone dimycocerosyl transferase C-terminus/Condensation domain
MRRPLGGFETAANLTSEAAAFNVVFVLRLAGGVAPERLAGALAALQRRHPLLGARIVADGRRYVFADGAPPPPLRLAERASGAAWRAVVEDELNRPLDGAVGPPLRCVYLGAGSGPSEIVLTVHHSVVDGASGAPLVSELVALCADAPAAGPQALDPTAAAWPPAAEALFPPRYRGWRSWPGLTAFGLRWLVDEVVHRLCAARRRPSPKPARCRILALRLNAAATAALVRRSRREKATLAGALTAALLVTAQRHLYGGEAGAMSYFTFADLRPYLVPPAASGTVAAYVSALRFTVPMPANRGFWPLARRISRQMGDAGRRGDKFHAARRMAATMRSVLSQRRTRMATVAISYAGAVRWAGGVGALRIRDLRAFVSNLAHGPELTASVKLVGEEVVWDIVYLDVDMDATLAKRAGAEIVRTLVRETEAGG